MDYRPVGRTEMKVSAISFGCWTMGGLNWVNGIPNGWANVDEEEVKAGIKAGLDAGVNHFDNADVYGNGRAERLLAKLLKELGVGSDSLLIATKLGHFRGTAEHAYHPFHIRRQCEQSLINLQRETVDIYYFHHGDFGPNDQWLDDAVATMEALMQEGKIRAVGLSAYSAEHFLRLAPKIRPAVLQSWAHALDDQYIRAGSPVDRLMEELGMTFVAFSPLAQARLLDKFNPNAMPEFEPGDMRQNHQSFKAEAIAALAPKLARLKERFGSTTEELAAMALNYVLAAPRVACAIPGFRNERQARCNVGAATRTLTADDAQFIREVCMP
jgi:aryl-alcohol dehydrogenase-like predicted oxidoreductase